MSNEEISREQAEAMFHELGELAKRASEAQERESELSASVENVLAEADVAIAEDSIAIPRELYEQVYEVSVRQLGEEYRGTALAHDRTVEFIKDATREKFAQIEREHEAE
ncbi:Uncharacterised protein (plasmid) [Tsukamurella tyrosinosolvens]|uniref:PE family protein n=1 Tax=Tsukamurella tyrosinosolvens TaxID=57704 RepID=A0A1H4QQN1_TSUTY|nr:hypothetical protein [Tsukamurella tyrosinosolvens]KXO91506.1 hypothetical protein AXK58_20120 [Tsukamurella tyrosinosolvens]SEC21969.1 hypothetical protein SAMN04489793_1820 [Tsukamurella tyrosinosolvens]VEH92503.1 Uncharacterised protein [Tsukamurella tyrosinosolvens]